MRFHKEPGQDIFESLMSVFSSFLDWINDHGQFFPRSSLHRMQIEQIGIGQLHWSTANYAPLQERALWDGLVAMHEKV